MPRILPADANFDESRVPPYTLPDPLRGEDGSRVRSASEWLERRRPELLERFASTVYGRTPFAARVAVTEVVRDWSSTLMCESRSDALRARSVFRSGSRTESSERR
jgi:hypothetical protein